MEKIFSGFTEKSFILLILFFLSFSVQAIAIQCNGLEATIVGTEENDVISGTNGADVIAGLGGNDYILGKDGDDVICGGAGNDFLVGNEGDDKIYGEEGNDMLVANKGNDIIDGGDGIDVCDGGIGADKDINCETASNVGPVNSGEKDRKNLNGTLSVPSGKAKK